MRKYITLYELLNMMRGIEDLLLEDNSVFLKQKYNVISRLYDESKLLGYVPRNSYNMIETIDNDILSYIGCG